eukprot:TRINITY_DN3327_c0_g1_i1.p2 TRINITY_DN3327_c0_g1~~TRINITY_DN3327_c0_g1_i1.p2  ORF type:complete len:172 (-),score=56.10 TRINITY_DN3327_c0_g1_i1:100-615(-)
MTTSGTCKSFNLSKGFGFITAADGKEHFFHKSDLAGKPPNPGDVLTFTVVPSDKKPDQTCAKSIMGGTMGGNLQGTCKWYDQTKGFGFIDYSGGSYFMHVSNIKGGTPQEGDSLYFDLVPGEKDPSKQECKNVIGGTGYPLDQAGKGWGKMGKFMPPWMMWGPYGGGKGKW